MNGLTTTKMHDSAMYAVFWLGLYKGFEGVGNNCSYCNKSTPTEAALPPHELHSPDYPFQMVVMDYCSIKCKSWLICADWFTGWVSTYYFPKETDASDLVKLQSMFLLTKEANLSPPSLRSSYSLGARTITRIQKMMAALTHSGNQSL